MAEEKNIVTKQEKKIPPVNNNGAVKGRKKFRFFSSLILIFAILLLFLTLLVSVTQTSFFRDFVKGYLVDMINEDFAKKQSSLKIGGLEGNFFSEIIITDVLLTVKQDEMIKLDKVSLIMIFSV